MADPSHHARRIQPATIALALAGLIALVAVTIALVNDGDNAAPGNVAEAKMPSVEESLANLAEQVRRNPDDDAGWFRLGLAYRQTEQLTEAAQAFARAMELRPRNADYAAYRAEMLLIAEARAGRPPPAEAERLFRRALALQPSNPQARFYLATIRDSRGDHRGAIDELIALLRDAPPGEVWPRQVRESVIAIARDNHIGLGDRLPPAPAGPPASATAAIPGPTPEQMAAASAIPPSRQDAMVRDMVERLAARLRQNPRDAQGWIRLMRSRMVLNDPPAARAALNSGLAAFQGDAATQGQLREAARTLGVP